MKIAIVVQRYGRNVIGGSETLARLLSEHLAKYFEIEVLTTCAKEHTTWENAFQPGTETYNSVVVRRFRNDAVRGENFDRLFGRLIFSKDSTTILDEIELQKIQGPYCPDLLNYIRVKSDEYDLFIFVTYLFFSTFFGLLTVPEKSILIPTAHNERSIYLDIFKTTFRIPKGMIFLSEGEQKFVHSQFRNTYIPYKTIGIGTDIIEGNNINFRKLYNINFPFVVYLGRIEEIKGVPKLIEFFLRYKDENPSDLKLVLIGEKSIYIPKHRDIVYLGTLTEFDRLNALKSAELLLQPSQYESFSLVLLESWSQSTPVLVNGYSDVLKGHCTQSNGGLYYTNYLEFAESMNLLMNDSQLRGKLGKNGYEYVKQKYSWDKIEQKYVNFIKEIGNL